MQAPRRPNTLFRRFCKQFIWVILLPFMPIWKYMVIIYKATDEMFLEHNFNLQFLTVLFDTSMQLASYLFLVLSIFEIREA